jgi:hypothetical protein
MMTMSLAVTAPPDRSRRLYEYFLIDHAGAVNDLSAAVRKKGTSVVIGSSVDARLHLRQPALQLQRRELRDPVEVIEECAKLQNIADCYGVALLTSGSAAALPRKRIQSGPRDKGPQWLPSSHGSRGWDAGGGDDW